MKFWDTSAILALLVDEQSSPLVDDVFSKDSLMIVWWDTSIECVSAVSRLERELVLSPEEANDILKRLKLLRSNWWELQPNTQLRQISERILRLHPLRAQDAQQLAACVMTNQSSPMEFVTLDKRLAIAASKEGLALAI